MNSIDSFSALIIDSVFTHLPREGALQLRQCSQLFFICFEQYNRLASSPILSMRHLFFVQELQSPHIQIVNLIHSITQTYKNILTSDPHARGYGVTVNDALDINAFFRQKLQSFPSFIVSLKFGNRFTRFVEQLPSSLLYLTFGDDFNQSVNCIEYWPPKLTHLSFGRKFDQPVESLPSSLLSLTFGEYFNKPVDHLSSSLLSLTFGDYFNKPVNHLPSKLKALTFGHYFNQSVDDLPLTVTHLILGCRHFNKPIDKLPPNLTHLALSYNFNHKIDRLPDSLTHLTFPKHCERYTFPPRHYFNQLINHLPQSLVYLSLGETFNQSIDALPPKLAYLRVGYGFRQKMLALPSSLTYFMSYPNHSWTEENGFISNDFEQQSNNFPFQALVPREFEEHTPISQNGDMLFIRKMAKPVHKPREAGALKDLI